MLQENNRNKWHISLLSPCRHYYHQKKNWAHQLYPRLPNQIRRKYAMELHPVRRSDEFLRSNIIYSSTWTKVLHINAHLKQVRL